MEALMVLLAILLQTLLTITTTTAAQFDPSAPIQVICSGDSNYTSNSAFESDLRSLLTSLATSAPSNGGFFNTSTPDNTVYGLAQCRGDKTPTECSDCLNRSASTILSQCPRRKQAVLRYDECLTRYSDKRFFSTLTTDGTQMLYNVNNASDQTQFNRQLGRLLNGLATNASRDATRFAEGEINYTDFVNLYGMVQCTRDLSGSDCLSCLTGSIADLPGCCSGKQGARVFNPSCYLRYESSLFYAPVSPPPPLPGLTSPPPGAQTTHSDGNKKNSSKTVIFIVAPTIAVLAFISAIAICYWRKKPKKKLPLGDGDQQQIQSAESLLFDFATLRLATVNFSESNKLGEGGFGPVYKGELSDGQQIAVKRLSRNSVQGLVELRNEVVFVARLQHRNLVRLLGWCLEEEEKLLVYEYMPNTSLDKFLFDPIKCAQLDWRMRYKIIEGIARGLLYLHEDSRLKIIHRDLKASNILLDGSMNAKISDFGLAKLFNLEQTQGNTSRIAGTYGYMAPEYAVKGQFSTKSDVFSFGVLVLEILTGRKNSGFHESEQATDLLTYVWKHWTEGTTQQLIGRAPPGQFPSREFHRCIHLGLLCVQGNPVDRPTMSFVVLMLSSHSLSVPAPSPPGYLLQSDQSSESSALLRGDLDDADGFSNQNENKTHSRNTISISEIEPR
ncbi:Cysteine-rich receptor-like protein kinase 8 [Acorus calamus]|uniref:Cysteine-rich receptor-like protein kinase 8 n=1 Tax=Acorus calamus TaxID=4465 RepID=A0AAV9FHS2_ACOCL|nr:Cysteine-rich receptor-like protein kinase 8 [Acorus calamus]